MLREIVKNTIVYRLISGDISCNIVFYFRFRYVCLSVFAFLG